MIPKYIDYIKKHIENSINKQNYENALTYTSLAADILYNYNQCYCDEDLENFISIISKKLLENNNEIKVCEKDTIIFYDGFGIDLRGLAQIYILGLSKNKRIIYITKEKQKQQVKEICKILQKSNNSYLFIPEGSNIDKIKFVNNLILKYKPRNIFMYTTPDDVIITTVLYNYENIITRYQINLTDHAFWIGCKCLDYCIEFRNYGAYISNKFRLISKEKIILLPYYPIINKNFEFKGYPFEFNEKKQKIVFSGGSLYKTFGDNNKYYLIVDYILSKFSDVIFWYAGYGNRKEIDKLISKYPGRCFITQERKDLYQVLKKCYFYLSTYPLCGGLMFQYAAAAGRLPITLKYDDSTNGFLINQENLGIEFNSIKEIEEAIEKILTDNKYLKKQEKNILNSIILPEVFEKNLKNLVDNQKTEFKVDLKPINIDRILAEYKANMTYEKLCNIIAGHKKISIYKLFPREIFDRKVLKIKNKIFK